MLTLLASGALAPVAGALQGPGTYTLGNAHATYVFEKDAQERTWLKSGRLGAGDVVNFEPTTHWRVLLDVDHKLHGSFQDYQLIADQRPDHSEDLTPCGLANNPSQATGSQSSQISLHHAAYDPGQFPVSGPMPGGQFLFDYKVVQIDRESFLRCNDPAPAASPFTSDPILAVAEFWVLREGEDFLRGQIGLQVLNTADTDYRIRSIEFPRLMAHSLRPTGEDWLATPSDGGRLYGDPIGYQDPINYEPFRFGETNVAQSVPLYYYYRESPAGPLGLYLTHDDDKGLLKYAELTPLRGEGAALDLLRYRLGRFPSGDIFDVKDYPAVEVAGDPYFIDEAFDAIVGVVEGDWVDAAKKYKALRTDPTDDRFTWLDPVGDTVARPAGHPDNPAIPDLMRQSPWQARLGESYCPGNIEFDAGNELEIQGALEFFRDRFLTPTGAPQLPYLMLDRFVLTHDGFSYDPDIGCTPSGGCPSYDLALQQPASSNAQVAHDFVRTLGAVPGDAAYDADLSGHLTWIGSLSEKYLVQDGYHQHFHTGEGTPGLESCPIDDDPVNNVDFVCGRDADYRKLMWACSIADSPALLVDQTPLDASVDLEPSFLTFGQFQPVCPLGLGVIETAPPLCGLGPVGDDFVQTSGYDVFEELCGLVANDLNVTGGFFFNTPTIGSQPACFADYYPAHYDLPGIEEGDYPHAHPPGAGNRMITRWFELMEDVSAAAGTVLNYTKESGGAMFAQGMRVQPPLSYDLAGNEARHPALGIDPDEDSVCVDHEWYRYFDAPIRRIPLLQMVADELRYMTHYPRTALALPFTDAQAQTRPKFFEEYPAVPAALQCWNLAKRTLTHQGSIALDRAFKVDDSFFDPQPAGATEEERRDSLAVRTMVEFYRGLARFLQAPTPHGGTNMAYLTGSMERNVELEILGEGGLPIEETFYLRAGDYSTLSAWLTGDGPTCAYPTEGFPPPVAEGLPGWSSDDIKLDFSKYRPVDSVLWFAENNANGQATDMYRKVPEERESWLPHGVYRHAEAEGAATQRLAVLVANPWGVWHYVLPEMQIKTMNPFTFDHSDPLSSPPTAYDFSFAFDPAAHGLADAPFMLVVKRFDWTGTELSSSAPATFPAGAQVPVTNLGPLEYAAFYISQ